MRVTRISIYPIKGTREVSVPEAEVHRRGLIGDRRWMVVEGEGHFLQQRVLPAMALIRSTLQPDGSLLIDAPGMSQLHVAPPDGARRVPVTVWSDTVEAALAAGEASDWFSQYLGLACQLVYMDPATVRPVNRKYGQDGDVVSFADAAPLLLATEASLSDLNSRLDVGVPMSRFRPNVTIDGVEPWEEDRWRRVQIGQVEFELTHACARCVVTTIDQESAVKSEDGEPLKTLAEFRRGSGGVYFGQNLVPRTLGMIHVGDTVKVCEYRDDRS